MDIVLDVVVTALLVMVFVIAVGSLVVLGLQVVARLWNRRRSAETDE